MKSLSTRHYVYIGALILLALVLASCAGLDLGDIVKVKTPNTIQQTTGLPSTLSLNEAEVEYQNWFNLTQTTGAQWKGNIEKAGEIRGLLGQLTLSALDTVGPTVAGLPVLGPALPALTGIVGLRRVGGRGGKLTSQKVKIAPRPYMAPALEKERPKLPLLWRNSIKKG